MKEKKKKEKITYVDDGRTIADMSRVGSHGLSSKPKEKKKDFIPSNLMGRGTLRDQWNTYKAAVKMMFLPMLVVILAIVLIFFTLGILFSVA